MAPYTILTPNGVATAARTMCQSKFLVVNLITLIFLIWTIAVYVIPLVMPTEPEEAMQPARSFVVPNIVHFVRYGPKPLTFIDAVCIFAALKHQKPRKVFVHTDQTVFNGGKYWDVVTSHPSSKGVVEVKRLDLELQGEYWKYKNITDMLVVKLKILIKYGGILLENDCYIVNSLNKFRLYALTLGWVRLPVLLNTVIIASSEAKFLKMWLKEVEKFPPTSISRRSGRAYNILQERPSLANWMKDWMIQTREVTDTVYLGLSSKWRYVSVVKLFIDLQYLIPRNVSETATYPVVFNETNIYDYNVNIQTMVQEVYPLPAKVDDKMLRNKDH